MSNGATQSLHPDFYSLQFPFLASRKQDVVLSDYFLQRKGFFETMEKLKEKRKKKVVIIGGSHSGFSAAWLLLNGPASMLHNSHEKPTCSYDYDRKGKYHFPDAVFKTMHECTRCCVCQYVNKSKGKNKPKCACICKCFGFFKNQEWGFDYENDRIDF